MPNSQIAGAPKIKPYMNNGVHKFLPFLLSLVFIIIALQVTTDSCATYSETEL